MLPLKNATNATKTPFESTLHFAVAESPDRFDTLFSDDHNWTLLIASNLPEVLERCDHVMELSSSNTDKTQANRPSSDVEEKEEGALSGNRRLPRELEHSIR